MRGLGLTATAPTASSPRRSRAGSRRTRASTSAASPARVRTAASSPATSPRRRRARACRPLQPRPHPLPRPARHAADGADRAGALGRENPRAVCARLVRGDAARQHAPDHRAAAHARQADDPAFLPDHRLRYRQAPDRARGDQRRRAQGQGRKARLENLGQRFRHQGAGGGADARARRQRHLDRGRSAQAQARRRRRRGRHNRRPDHADRAPGRHEIAVGDLQRDEGLRRARAGAKTQAGGIPGRHHGGVEPRHVRHQGVLCRHQPAARDHSLGRRRRGARRSCATARSRRRR